MPFAEEFTDVYQYLIKEGLESAGYIVKRADDIKSQNNILSDIVQGIVSSDLIITDLTGANPNVYYELGIAHALNKNVILLTQEIGELPFDLRSYRVISYNVHFSKMNEAKNELSELASKAYNNNLPFSNPIKDFSAVTTDNPNDLVVEQECIVNDIDELGLLDYIVVLEDGLEKLTNIMEEVAGKLENELTPEMEAAGKKLKSSKYSTKQKQKILKDYGSHMQKYGAFLKIQNKDYKALLSSIESSLEYILGGRVETEGNDLEGLGELVSSFEGIEGASFDAREGFISLIAAMQSIPKLEKNFNRAKVFMATELKAFVDNIDLTASISARASRLGKSLINKEEDL